MSRHKNSEIADPFGVQPCGFVCFECPFDDCLWACGANRKKMEAKRAALSKKIKLQTYDAPEWKWTPRHMGERKENRHGETD